MKVKRNAKHLLPLELFLLQSESLSLYRRFIKQLSFMNDKDLKYEMQKEIRRNWEDTRPANNDPIHMRSLLAAGSQEIARVRSMALMLDRQAPVPDPPENQSTQNTN